MHALMGARRLSPSDSNACAHVSPLLEEVRDPDRVILGADLAIAALVDQKLVSAEAVTPSSLAGVDERGWAYVCPVEIRDALKERERIGALGGFGLELVRKVRGVQEPDARRDLEAGGAADDHEAPDAGSTQTVGQGASHVLQRVIDAAGRDGAYDRVRAGGRGGHGGWVGDVSAGSAARADDLVAALLELGRDPTADHACGSEDSVAIRLPIMPVDPKTTIFMCSPETILLRLPPATITCSY
jgi:hypothetical protein